MLRYRAAILLTLLPLVAEAQPSRDPRVAVAVMFGAGTSDAGTINCCELRTPPVLVRVAEQPANPRVGGVDGRFYWSPRTSTFVQFEASNQRSWEFGYQTSDSTPPFARYDARRNGSTRHRAWSVGQSFELVTHSPVRPYVFGGLTARRIVEAQHDVRVSAADPTVRLESDRTWSRRELMLSGGVGARALLAPRMFAGAEVARGFLGTHSCSTECSGRSERPAGFAEPRLVSLRVMLGVMFR